MSFLAPGGRLLVAILWLFMSVHCFHDNKRFQVPGFDVFGSSPEDQKMEELPQASQERVYANHSLQANQWSSSPTCSQGSANAPQYCVFTSSTFANNRGISLLVTPEQAGYISTYTAFTDKAIHHRLGINQFDSPPFVAREIENHGIGLIANRTIQRGEWLMSFTPAFLKARDSHEDLSRRERFELQRLAFQQLPQRLRKVAENLFGQSEKRTDYINDILETNSFALSLDIGDPEEEFEIQLDFLFPEIARFNHDCRPSADYFFDSSTLTLHVVAFRDIFSGEELTISYIDPLQRRRARQKALYRSWGFKCDCPLCTSSIEDVEVSDARIEKIIELRQELDDDSEQSEADPAMAEHLISLLKRERLWTLLHDAYVTTAWEYNGVGDGVNAQVYAMLALQSGLTCRGPDNYDESYRSMQLLLDDPQNHPSWLFRVSNR